MSSPDNDGDVIALNEQWRRERDARCRDPNGWLSLAGLHFLTDGVHRVGAHADDAVRFDVPSTSLPPVTLGTVRVDAAQQSVEFSRNPDLVGTIEVTLDGAPLLDAVPRRLEWAEDRATLVRAGTLTFFIKKSGDRFAIRLRDRENAVLRDFRGLDYWPIDAAYRVTATLVPHAGGPLEVRLPTAAGTVDVETSPGDLHFELLGQPLVLRPTTSGARLQIVVADLTTNKETYGGGRFVYCDAPRDGAATTVLDFNQAYNPPCVFTPFCMCPLPPKENKLKVRIEAGEKMYHTGAADHHHDH